MQAKLEQVLEQKEQELKLYRRFLDLRNYCEETVFPALPFPLSDHIQALKEIMEKLLPEPKDRKEEMFSGEIFALLGSLYLHDIWLAESPAGRGTDELFRFLDRPRRTIIASNEIGSRLNIPAQAMEIINYLSLSHITKKFAAKWEIEEEGKRAILRNTKVLQYVFNFSHLLLDAFAPDLCHLSLRRYGSTGVGLNPRKVGLHIDSREGEIHITYHDASPYEMHHLKRVRGFVEGAFNAFRNNVNGRLGFQYRRIKWDIDIGPVKGDQAEPGLRFSRYEGGAVPRYPRWDEASSILDRMFESGSVLLTGEESAGKTTLLSAFILPQLAELTPHAFYCEVWRQPVSEIKDAICSRYENLGYRGYDIVSVCNRILEKGPCIFLLDSCERLSAIEPEEREKMERFLDFCDGNENIYLIACGAKDTFFGWHRLFGKMPLSSIHELAPIDPEQARTHYRLPEGTWTDEQHCRPLDWELGMEGRDLGRVIGEALQGAGDTDGLRGVLSVLVRTSRGSTRRYSMEELRFETGLPTARVVENLYRLKKADFVSESRLGDSKFYSLSNECLREALVEVLALHEYGERDELRQLLGKALESGVLPDGTTLDLARKWKERMFFSGEETGLILAGSIASGQDHTPFSEKASADATGIDIQPLLNLLNSGNPETRRRAVELLLQAQDKGTINPLLRHLKTENTREIRSMVVKGIGRIGKRGAMIALVKTLREIGERDLRLKAVRFFASILGDNGRSLLLDLREEEEDPEIKAEINRLLSKPGT